MGGLPKLEELRSVSKFGISVVTIVFDEGTDIYRARQLVAERIATAAAEISQRRTARLSSVRSPRRWARSAI